MDYTIYRCSTGEILDMLSMHVFARAYRNAWWALYFCDPVGKHTIAGLDLVIEFSGRTAASRSCAQTIEDSDKRADPGREGETRDP